MQTIQTQKARCRRALKAARASIAPAVKRELDQRRYQRCMKLRCISAARCVFSFVSMPEEAETHRLIKALLKSGKRLCVPKITADGDMQATLLQDWGQLESGEFGILTPRADKICTGKIDVCITPGLGFSAQGQRIGSGGGYYDAWFCEHPHTLKIALAYECQILEAIPTAEHDIALDLIISEERVIDVARRC